MWEGQAGWGMGGQTGVNMRNRMGLSLLEQCGRLGHRLVWEEELPMGWDTECGRRDRVDAGTGGVARTFRAGSLKHR